MTEKNRLSNDPSWDPRLKWREARRHKVAHGVADENMKLLLFLIQSVQSVGSRKPDIRSQHCCFIMATLVSGSFLQGLRSDSSADGGSATERWSSSIALPEIFWFAPLSRSRHIQPLRIHRFALAVTRGLICFLTRSCKSKTKVLVLSGSFLSLQEPQWGQVELSWNPQWWSGVRKAVSSLKPHFYFHFLNVNTHIEAKRKRYSECFHHLWPIYMRHGF